MNLGADMKKINFCFKIIKDYYVDIKTKSKQQTPQQSIISNNTTGASNNQSITIVDASHYDNKETKDLKDLLKQRDNEISNQFK
jgi:hypothetical protein